MTFDFRTVEVMFPSGTGPTLTQTKTVTFASHINRAITAIKTFDIRYTNNNHPFFRQAVDTSAESIDNKTVTVKVELRIGDRTGDVNPNPFQGTVVVVVVADVT